MLRRISFALATTAAIAGCAGRTLPNAPQRPQVSWGETYCTPIGPVSWLNLDLVGTVEFDGTVAHERKHVEQILRFDSCRSFEAWYLTSQADAEIEAYCEQIKVDTRRGATRDASILRYARWLSFYEHVQQNTAEIIGMMQKACKS